MRYQIFIGESQNTMHYAGTTDDMPSAKAWGEKLQREAAPVPVMIDVREHPDDIAWPKHPDGRPMTMGQMTPEQRRTQTKIALKRLETELARPEVQAAIQRILDADKPAD